LSSSLLQWSASSASFLVKNNGAAYPLRRCVTYVFYFLLSSWFVVSIIFAFDCSVAYIRHRYRFLVSTLNVVLSSHSHRRLSIRIRPLAPCLSGCVPTVSCARLSPRNFYVWKLVLSKLWRIFEDLQAIHPMFEAAYYNLLGTWAV
jgi:hypothetical protein